MSLKNEKLIAIYEGLVARNGHEKEYLQAVLEVLESLEPVVEQRPELIEKGVMDRIDASPYEGPLICELTRGNKPGRNDHDGYAAMTMEGFYAFALDRARMVRDRKL